MNYKAILSLTTHDIRTKMVLRTLAPIIQIYRDNVKIILNLHISDYQYLTAEIYNLIHLGAIELFLTPIDLGPHLKYFFSILRYNRYLPVILIDDDIVYPDDFIDEMLKYNEKYPECILSRRPEKITFQPNGELLHYHMWKRPYFCDEPVNDSLATGVGGVLFPKDAFKLGNDNIKELLEKCKFDDDIYLKVLAVRNGRMIKSIQSKTMYKTILDDRETQQIALCNRNWNRTLDSLKKFPDEVRKIKEGISR